MCARSSVDRRGRRAGAARRPVWIAFLALAGSAFAACGGGSGTGGGGLAFQAVWEQPATVAGQQVGCQGPLPTPVPSGFGPDIPDSVSLIQIEIEAADGSACCIRFLKQENRRRASFVDLPEGEAHLTISGFPAPEYAASSTLPECRLDRAAPNPPSFACAGEDSGTFSNPSFQSRRTAVQIPSAGSRNAGTIPISARPFVLLGECDGPPVVTLIAPPPGGTTNAIVGFIVADARGGIQQESVRATVLQGSQQFEMPLARTPCTDQEQGCSCRGAMGVTGVRNVGRLAGRISPVQPGPARLLISATSCDGQTEDFEYPFTYEPLADTPTATASITPVPTDTPTATASITPVPTETATTTPSASPTVTPTPRILLRITGDQVAVGDVGTLSVSLVVPQGVIVVDLDQRIGFSPQAIIIQDCAPSAPITDREFDWGFGSCEFNCDVLQATISRLDDQPLPSSVLYVCNFTINAMAGPGPHDLTCLDETTLTDRDGQVLRPICIPGEVEVISP